MERSRLVHSGLNILLFLGYFEICHLLFENCYIWVTFGKIGLLFMKTLGRTAHISTTGLRHFLLLSPPPLALDRVSIAFFSFHFFFAFALILIIKTTLKLFLKVLQFVLNLKLYLSLLSS